ncbi:MAG: 2-amino-4-hydroxy-6-hydroxymethyldihydropteridine diphosphokinase [Clostridia bacterium]|nr:2-amino-4-hydroxy-6-hydroxymethyldihydropteridine diphosphokinase [Clostridia bacterium]
MMNKDSIFINDLVVFANHGVMNEEKTMGQKFLVTLGLYADMSRAAGTDDIAHAINYAQVCSFVTEFTKNNRSKLIEAAAENIANALLIAYPMLEAVEITLKKPWAPIGLPLDGVAARLTRKRSTAYIGIGSNLGDKKAYLDFAVDALRESESVRVVKVSEYIVTEPVGEVEQDDFLNACIEIDTVLTPSALLELLHEIENRAGRERTVHWGPRTLDMDILLYGDEVICTPELVIPHPELVKREFALGPLAEIAPYVYHPVAREYAVNLLEKLK